MKKRLLTILIAGLVIISSVTLISFKDDDFKIVKSLDIFYTLFRELNIFYVDETDPEKLIHKSIEGMLESLDPYTSFIPESEMDNLQFMTTGKYGGIGALIRKAGNFAVIAEPYEGFPAQKAGLRAGDVVIEIDGNSTEGKSIKEISEELKGIPNTKVKVKIKRNDQDELQKTITREIISIKNVPYYGMVSKDIGYIRLSNFTQDAHVEVKNALQELKDEHDAKSLILDVRGNPGGLLIEAVHIANIFVHKDQEIVSTHGKIKQWDHVYYTDESPTDTVIPLVILVNRGSASASEIIAGAIQDLDRGVIIGQQTFGKGLVQTTRSLSYNTSLKVTTAKYYIPSGRCIQALDYSNRNEDGSMGHIPDSLISEFKTKNGRTVFDGGGILPDFVTEFEQFSKITLSLFTKNLVFDYATDYFSQHDSITTFEEFNYSYKDYENFKTFIQNKDFDYQTKSEELLEKLEKITKQEKYFDLAKDHFIQLHDVLEHDKNKDLETFKDEIIQLIKEEIISRYYYQAGRIQMAISNDDAMNKAIELLNNPEDYYSILSDTTKHSNDVFLIPSKTDEYQTAINKMLETMILL